MVSHGHGGQLPNVSGVPVSESLSGAGIILTSTHNLNFQSGEAPPHGLQLTFGFVCPRPRPEPAVTQVVPWSRRLTVPTVPVDSDIRLTARVSPASMRVSGLLAG